MERLNQAMLALSRLWNPAVLAIDGPYEMDPALQLPVLPGLAPARELATLDPSFDHARFLLVRLRPQSYRVHGANLQAITIVDAVLEGEFA